MGSRPTDNVAARNKILEEAMENRISAQDEYTTATNLLYRKKYTAIERSNDRIINHDHITPVAVIDERYWYLTQEQRRKLASESKSNLAITSGHLNQSKQDLENHEYLWREYINIKKERREAKIKKETAYSAKEINEAKRLEKNAEDKLKRLNERVKPMLKKELQSRAASAGKVTVMQTSNVVSANKDRIIVKACMESIQSAVAVAKGERELDEAVVRTTFETGKYGTQLILSQIVVQDLSSQTYNLLKAAKVDMKVFDTVKGVAGTMLQIYEAASLIVCNLVDLVNDEVSGEELLDSLCKGGVTMILARVVGTAALGPIVGPLLSSIVCSALCILYDEFAEALRGPKHQIEEYLSNVRKITQEAMEELQNQKEYLHSTVLHMIEKDERDLKEGITLLVKAIFECNAEIAVDGMNRMLQSYGEKVRFSNMDEFDAFFFDENAEFDLGGEG